jgi:hypothetical protein
MQYPSSQIFLLCMGTLEVHWTALSKNGITDLFFLPDEAKRLGNNLLVDPLTPVKIMDLSVGKSLPFPTFYYLSQSDRILQLSVPDEIFSPGKITGLKAINTSTIFMNSKDIPLFKQYYSTQLSELELPPDISESESAWLAESTYLEFLKYIICRPELQIKLTEFKKRFSVVLQDTFSKSTEGQNWKQRVSALSGNTTSTVQFSLSLARLIILLSKRLELTSEEATKLANIALIRDLFHMNLFPEEFFSDFCILPETSIKINHKQEEVLQFVTSILKQSTWNKNASNVSILSILGLE